MKIDDVIQILKSTGYKEAKYGDEYKEKSYFESFEDDKIKLVWTNVIGGECWMWFAENAEESISGVNY